MSHQLRSILVVGLALAAGVAQGFIIPVTAGRAVGGDARLPPPGPALQMAQEESPYQIREPDYLPTGFSLFNVIVTEPDVGESAYSVDLWYTSGGQEFVHIWQTDNDQLGAVGKDPSAADPSRTPVFLRGKMWQLERLAQPALTALSSRFEGGITLSLDGNLNEKELRRIAESIP